MIAERILRRKQQFSINVRTGIVDGCLVGLRVLSHRLTSSHYKISLIHDLSKIVEDVPRSENTNAVNV
jgi:hypothetical protein